jgi:hypothetical protein
LRNSSAMESQYRPLAIFQATVSSTKKFPVQSISVLVVNTWISMSSTLPY